VIRPARIAPALVLAALVLVFGGGLAADKHAQERQIGLQAYNDFRTKGQIVRDSPYAATLNAIGRKVAAAAQPVWFAERFIVVKGDQANAFSAPGGYVFVNEGLLRDVENETELANVVGHETAHLKLGHVTAKLETKKKAGLISKIGNMFGRSQTAQKAVKAAGYGAQYSFLNFTRQQEYAADQEGANLAAAAGYNPWGSIWFFKAIKRLEGDVGFEAFVQQHPSISDRIGRLEKYLKSNRKFRRWSSRMPSSSGLPL